MSLARQQHIKGKGKGKAIRLQARQALKVPGVWGSQISRQSAHEGGKVVSPTHRPPLPLGNIPGTRFFRGWVNPRTIVRPEGLCQWKIPTTTSGIEPATFRLVAQCLNQLRYRVTQQQITASVSKNIRPHERITRGAKQLDKERWPRTAVHCEFCSTEMVPT